MGPQQQMVLGRPLPQELRADALARGRERLRRGPVPSDVLAAAVVDAHALLRTPILTTALPGPSALH